MHAVAALANHRPRIVLFAIVWFAAVLLQPGDLGTSDTAMRLQVARWLWTDEPQVRPEDRNGFGAPNHEGEFMAWYGIGQSLVLLPADVAAAGLAKTLGVGGDMRETFVAALVSLLVFPLVAAAGVVCAFSLLLELGFGRAASLCAALGLFWGTTFLHYAQIGQENSLEFLLLAGGMTLLLRWTSDGLRRNLFAASLVLGCLILVRIPHVVTILAVFLFAAHVVRRRAPESFARRALDVLAIAVPVFAAYCLADRFYQFIRFGSFATTYVGECYDYVRLRNPSLPESFPFSTPFATGFLGPLVSVHKSVFLYDPLLVGAIPVLLAAKSAVRSFAVLFAGIALFFILFYSTYFSWFGGSSWGNRFTTVPVNLMALAGIAVAAESWPRLRPNVRRLLAALACFAVALQLMSTVFWYNLEIQQADRDQARPAHVVARPANIARKIAGSGDQWVRSSRLGVPNYMPFLAEHARGGSALLTGLQFAWGIGAILVLGASGVVFRAAWGGARDGSAPPGAAGVSP